jgi:hypothetical protein
MLLALPAWAGPAEPCGSHPNDADSDTVCDALDGCDALAGVPNCDTDSDGFANPCDGDFNQNGVVQGNDFTGIFIPDFIAGLDNSNTGTDMNCNGVVQGNDFTSFFIPQFLQGAPGP